MPRPGARDRGHGRRRSARGRAVSRRKRTVLSNMRRPVLGPTSKRDRTGPRHAGHAPCPRNPGGSRTMPTAPKNPDVLRVAAVADVHCSHNCPGTLLPLFTQIAQSADVLALCGDLTDYGQPEEAQALVNELSSIKLPTVAVLGNHDYESDKHGEIRQIFTDAGITVLDGEATEI